MADKHGVALYPFFLDGVVTHANLQLEDGMHPNSGGVDVMVKTMLPAAETFLKSITAGE
jgi:acyl-CoA thioesterase I